MDRPAGAAEGAPLPGLWLPADGGWSMAWVEGERAAACLEASSPVAAAPDARDAEAHGPGSARVAEVWMDGRCVARDLTGWAVRPAYLAAGALVGAAPSRHDAGTREEGSGALPDLILAAARLPLLVCKSGGGGAGHGAAAEPVEVTLFPGASGPIAWDAAGDTLTARLEGSEGDDGFTLRLRFGPPPTSWEVEPASPEGGLSVRAGPAATLLLAGGAETESMRALEAADFLPAHLRQAAQPPDEGLHMEVAGGGGSDSLSPWKVLSSALPWLQVRVRQAAERCWASAGVAPEERKEGDGASGAAPSSAPAGASGREGAATVHSLFREGRNREGLDLLARLLDEGMRAGPAGPATWDPIPGRASRAEALLAAMVDGLLGWAPDREAERAVLSPAFPGRVEDITVEGLEVGDARLSLTRRYRGGRISYRLEPTGGRTPLRLVFSPRLPAGAVREVWLDGAPGSLDRIPVAGGEEFPVQLSLDRGRRVDFLLAE
ncbi:MAG: hypothetical protein ACE5GJ_13680 [Gemmatimonadota bacterium]